MTRPHHRWQCGLQLRRPSRHVEPADLHLRPLAGEPPAGDSGWVCGGIHLRRHRPEFSGRCARPGRRVGYYDPQTGTFLTKDPLDGVDGQPTVANRYHYVDNDPLNRTDPLGLRPNDVCLNAQLQGDSAAMGSGGGALADHLKNGDDEDWCLRYFDTKNGGHSVATLGNMKTAKNIVIAVNGMEQDLGNNSAIPMAASIQREASNIGGYGTAAIAWHGYDSPHITQPIDMLTAGGKALGGGRTLASYTRAVRSIRPDAHITVVGHSFGSYVAAYSMVAGNDVDDVVVTGGAGMSDSWNSVASTGFKGHLYFGEAPDDWVIDLTRHSSGVFAGNYSNMSGARRLDCAGSTGHNNYYSLG